ncbi:hypothetical protein ABZP36_001891 [Zizania latifolia]
MDGSKINGSGREREDEERRRPATQASRCARGFRNSAHAEPLAGSPPLPSSLSLSLSSGFFLSFRPRLLPSSSSSSPPVLTHARTSLH